ncbi:hypothetical protein [Halalkalibacter oceani]|uniref:hypothetical protein n=1 Tax=Halalkalibacter oceani TaxID=1653776 RepID=UPI003396E707
MPKLDSYYEKKAKEQAYLVLEKLDDNIYEVIKDDQGTFSGSLYVNNNDVLDSLNNELKVLVSDRSSNYHYVNFQVMV